MPKYINVVFKSQYDGEIPSVRYERLNREFNTKLNKYLIVWREELKNELEPESDDEIDKLITGYQRQALDLQNVIQSLWTRSQRNAKNLFVAPRIGIDEKLYLIEALARVGMAFEHPNDLKNTYQLSLLAQSIPGVVSGLWLMLTNMLFTLAIIASLLITLILMTGPVGPLVIILIAVPHAFFYVAGSLALLAATEQADKSQPVKNGISSVIIDRPLVAPLAPDQPYAKTGMDTTESDAVQAENDEKPSAFL